MPTTNINEEALIKLVAGAMAADYTEVRRAGAILAGEMQHSSPRTAQRLRSLLNRRGVALQASGFTEALPVDAKSRFPLVEEQSHPTVPLFVNELAQNVFCSFLDDAKNFAALSAEGISSRLSILLSGPPGTGKTLLAGHIAAHLKRPLYVVRLDSVISSLLGDTAKNIRSIFDFFPSRGILFLDELDAVAKIRDDRHELGELKRVVNTLLQGMDSLDDRAIVIGATNHAQLLDPAVWRRFPYSINLDLPDLEIRSNIWSYYLAMEDLDADAARVFASLSSGLSGADIQSLALSARRKAVLTKREIDVLALATAVLSYRGNNSDVGGGVTREVIVRMAITEGLSQVSIARFLGVTRQAISAYLKGGDRNVARKKR